MLTCSLNFIPKDCRRRWRSSHFKIESGVRRVGHGAGAERDSILYMVAPIHLAPAFLWLKLSFDKL
jgi:hypothetical protein